MAGDLVRRDRLHEQLDLGRQTPLTLVAAPAGYGKSTAVSHWAESLDTPPAWVSLDESDGDPLVFGRYVLAAVETVLPGACAETAALVDAASPPPVPVLARCLVNELDALDGPVVLVLDDYHRIGGESEVHELLGRMLEHPPLPLRLVIVTRRDPPLPLGTLRARGHLTEVRLQDLRFTAPEAVELLATAAQVRVGEDALENLQHEVEGWAVGLRLLTLALRHVEDPDSFLKDLRGGLPHTHDYLLREVLAAQPAGVREGMLRASILDRFCPEAVDAVCAEGEGSAPAGPGGHELVELLQQSHLFTIPLDARGEWFRYHHLFQDLLRRQLAERASTEEMAELHARASEWFESQGLIEEALRHALEARDLERAAGLVERNRHSAVDADRWYDLEKWVSLLPDALVRERPDLMMARAWVFLHHTHLEALLPTLDRVESLLEDDPAQDSLRGEVALFRGYVLYFLGEGAASLEYMKKALEQIPGSFEEGRVQAELIFALALQMEGRKGQAIRGLDDLLAQLRSPNEGRETRLLGTHVFIHILSGDLAAADASNRRFREVAERSRYPDSEAWAAYLQGLIHLHRYELDAAIEHLRRSASQRLLHSHFRRAAVDSIGGLISPSRPRDEGTRPRPRSSSSGSTSLPWMIPRSGRGWIPRKRDSP